MNMEGQVVGALNEIFVGETEQHLIKLIKDFLG